MEIIIGIVVLVAVAAYLVVRNGKADQTVTEFAPYKIEEPVKAPVVEAAPAPAKPKQTGASAKKTPAKITAKKAPAKKPTTKAPAKKAPVKKTVAKKPATK